MSRGHAAMVEGVPLGALRTGDVFGEMSLVHSNKTTATVVATRQATVLFLGREYVAKIVAAVPEIKSYLEALAEDQRSTISSRSARTTRRRTSASSSDDLH